MGLDIFLGSQTKADIIKYLFFCRQGISLRALENNLDWSFPAIKKQVENLYNSSILDIDKSGGTWKIYFTESGYNIVKELIFFYLKEDLISIFNKFDGFVKNCYLGNKFGFDIDVDIVFITINKDDNVKLNVQNEVDKLFKQYFVDNLRVVFMCMEEFDMRNKVADKFVRDLVIKGKKLL